MSIRLQFFRYALVGVGSNAVLYLLYVLVTHVGVGHKTAMTAIYLLGVLQTFLFNRNWSFGHRGHVTKALVRYALAYAAGYILNLAVLVLLVDYWRLQHQVVQGVMILALALFLFLLQRYWVFRPAGADMPAAIAR